MEKIGKSSKSALHFTPEDHERADKIVKQLNFPHKITMLREGMRILEIIASLKTEWEIAVFSKNNIEGNNKKGNYED